MLHVTVTEAEFLALGEKMRPFTERVMKIEVAIWIKDYEVHMEELYTELSLEKMDYKLQGEETSVVEDYRELFTKCLAKKQNQSESVHSISEADSLVYESDSRSNICCCFGKSRSNLTQKVKRIKRKEISTQANAGEKILGKGDPGMGKTHGVRKLPLTGRRGCSLLFP